MPLHPLGIHQWSAPTRGLSVPAALLGPEELARAAGLSTFLRLGSNESPYGPSPRALEAIRRSAEMAHRYGDPANHELREAVAARHGVALEEVCVGAGVDDLLGLGVRAHLCAGSPAVAMAGTFPTFEMHATMLSATFHRVPYKEPRVDLPALLDALQAAGGLLYVANPDNPSGSHWRWSEIMSLVDNMPENSLLIHDEAYASFLPVVERPPMSLVDPRVLRMRTFSKEHGLAALRVGYAIGAAETIAALEAIRALYSVSRIAQAAALASLEDDAYVSDVIDRIGRGREEYHEMGASLGLPTVPSVTSFVLFDCGDVTRAELVQKELLKRGIHIRKPAAGVLARYVRISVGSEDERPILRRALEDIIGTARSPLKP